MSVLFRFRLLELHLLSVVFTLLLLVSGVFSKVPRVGFFFPPLAAARFVCVLFFQLCFVICLCKSTTPQRLWKHEPLFFFWCASCDYYSWSHMRTAKVIIAVHFASTHCRYNHSRGFAATRRITNLLHTVCRSCFFFFFFPLKTQMSPAGIIMNEPGRCPGRMQELKVSQQFKEMGTLCSLLLHLP